jgi:hypothetical protein
MDQQLRLNAETGKLFWIQPPKYHPDLIGKEAGCLQKNQKKNYWIVQVNGKKYRRSHIVFYFANGYWAKPCIDHINGDSTDDRPTNLRQATSTQNAWNHKKRARRIQLPIGVRKLASGKFQARIGYFGKQIHLGSFQSPDEASTIYQSKRKNHHSKRL